MTGKTASSRAATIISAILTLASLAFGLVLGLVGTLVIPQFAEVFESFGTDLPAVTALLINSPHVLWTPLALTMPTIVLWWPLRSNAARIVCYSMLTAADAILLVLTIVAMYLPIYKLGQVA
jgi:type II secretory pathway component PulF